MGAAQGLPRQPDLVLSGVAESTNGLEEWLFGRIDELLAAGKAFLEVESEAVGRAFFAEAIALASGELLDGIRSEARAGRLANATRLARHLFEQQIELHYVLSNFEPRMRQRVAEEARNALDHSETEVADGSHKATLAQFLQDARAREAAAEKLKKDEGKKTPADERGFFPPWEQRARAVDLEDRYVDYRQMSAIAHPGLRAAAPHVRIIDASGEAQVAGVRAQLRQLVLCEGVIVFSDILATGVLLREGFSEEFHRLIAIRQAGVRCCSAPEDSPVG